MKKLISLCALLLLAAASAFAAAGLPDVSGWKCGELRVTKLDTVSGNKGQWLERDYRTAAGAPFHAVWLEGAGEKNWQVQPQKSASGDGTGATYKTVEIAGSKAVLERHPVTGVSLAVKLDKRGTLTLESGKATTDDEIIAAAQAIIDAMK